MIDYKRNFLAVNGVIYYIDLLLDFAIQRGIMDESFGDIGFLQPGMVGFTSQEIIPLETDMMINTKIELESPIFMYIINYITVFNNPQIKFTYSGNSKNDFFYQVKSQKVDILQERFRKYTSEHRIKTMINTLYLK